MVEMGVYNLSLKCHILYGLSVTLNHCLQEIFLSASKNFDNYSSRETKDRGHGLQSFLTGNCFVFLVYDPDPISSLRKRRISADSVDSGSASGREMHPHTAHDLSRLAVVPTSASHCVTPPAVTPTKSVTSDGEATSSPIKRKREKSGKKHKKKHKHHHCKHKHKKHSKSIENDEEEEVNDNDNEEEDGEEEDVVVGEEDDLRIKLDGSFNNTTTYSIRSPIYHARSEESNHDEEGDDESSDDDGFSDDDHVTTVKTVSLKK